MEESETGGSSSPNLGPVPTAIHNISARQLHDIASTTPDDRQFLRGWRRQLQDCLSQQNSRMVRFLLAEGGDPATGTPDISRRAADVLTKYSRPTWNFAASTRDLMPITDTTETDAYIVTEIGMSPALLRDAMKRSIRLYVNAAAGLTAAEARLEEKLSRLETITERVNDLMFLEPTPELESLSGPARAYLDSIFAKINLEEDYKAMVEQYKRFVVLRSLVSLSQSSPARAPMCTICMTKEVNQAIIPCGHTFCGDCCRDQMTACYICRVQIRDKVRLYFS